ncbi:MAG: serpin family protein [Gemmatimonadales bacterium]|jgi:serpin B
MYRALAVLSVIWPVVATVSCGQEVVGTQEITALPRELGSAESGLIDADNAFGLKLFAQVLEGEREGANVFVSPLSVAMALAMAYNGADGATQQAMQETLELQDLSLEEVNRSYRDLIDLLRGLDPDVEFSIGNSIWYDQRYTFQQEFLDVNREYFDAEVTGLDFAAPDAAATINDWVSSKTQGRIDQIVAPPISPDLVMFLINAIYFKGDWSRPFDKERTRPAPFTLTDGSQKQVDMMFYPQPDSVYVYSDAGVTVLDLPYGGRAYSMTIVLPAEGTDVRSLVGSLAAEAWRRWTEELRVERAIVSMPKFTLEYELELSEALKALGMGVAFDPAAADFTRIYSGDERVFISKVKHKTFVDVNEEGTEAAAATSVEVGVTSLPPMIAVDRPFVFAIREKLSGTILFLGVIEDPTKES